MASVWRRPPFAAHRPASHLPEARWSPLEPLRTSPSPHPRVAGARPDFNNLLPSHPQPVIRPAPIHHHLFHLLHLHPRPLPSLPIPASSRSARLLHAPRLRGLGIVHPFSSGKAAAEKPPDPNEQRIALALATIVQPHLEQPRDGVAALACLDLLRLRAQARLVWPRRRLALPPLHCVLAWPRTPVPLQPKPHSRQARRQPLPQQLLLLLSLWTTTSRECPSGIASLIPSRRVPLPLPGPVTLRPRRNPPGCCWQPPNPCLR